MMASVIPGISSAYSADCLPTARETCPIDYSMPSVSMTPTVLQGEHFYVDTQRYITHWPELGEVVVFLLPSDNNIKYFKRVVGLPGYRIQMRGGVLFINGEAVKKERIEDYIGFGPKSVGAGNPVPQFEETLPNGVKYRVLDELPGDKSSGDSTIEYLVPAKHYFIMGDHRDNSEDSRYDSVGYVPRENIIAKAASIYFSWTFARIGQKIQ
jgi:signal peptidase I